MMLVPVLTGGRTVTDALAFDNMSCLLMSYISFMFMILEHWICLIASNREHKRLAVFQDKCESRPGMGLQPSPVSF